MPRRTRRTHARPTSDRLAQGMVQVARQAAEAAARRHEPAARLMSVSCVSAKFCVAVDQQGDALTWNGTSWSSPQFIDSNTDLT